MQSKDRLVIDKIHNIVNINPESVGENMKYNGRVASQGGWREQNKTCIW